MKNRPKQIVKYPAGIVLLPLLFTISCRDLSTDSVRDGTITDADLFSRVADRASWVRYKFAADTLLRSSGSGHSQPRLVVRYNPLAATQLDVNGRVRAGALFPDSSLIVKELITADQLTLLAVMMKLPASPQNGSGWVWAELEPSGSPFISVAAQGKGCTGCHSAGVDQTRMNDAQP